MHGLSLKVKACLDSLVVTRLDPDISRHYEGTYTPKSLHGRFHGFEARDGQNDEVPSQTLGPSPLDEETHPLRAGETP